MGIKRNEYTYNPRACIGMVGYRSTVVSGPGGNGHAHHHQHLRHPLQVASRVQPRFVAPRMNPATSLTLTMLPTPSSLPMIKHEVPPPPLMRSLNCFIPNHHYARPESTFIQQGAASVYSSGASGTSSQAVLRGTSTAPQPPTSAQQQDLTKQSMGFAQQQSQQTRPSMSNYSYRPPHPSTHVPRPPTHHRLYGNTSDGSTVYGQMTAINPSMMSQLYQQPQHPVGPTPPYAQQRQSYYASNSGALQSIMQQQHAAGYYTSFQNQPTYCYSPAGALLERLPQAQSAPTPTPRFPAHAHIASTHGGTLPPSSTIQPKRPRARPHALMIINPETGDQVDTDNNEESQTLSGESSERQTPHQEISRIAEEFKERVKDSVNEDLHNASHMNAISKFTDSISNSDDKQIPEAEQSVAEITDVLSVFTESMPEPSGTPVVSALSNSPEIVPKQSLSSLKPQILTVEQSQSELSSPVTKDVSKETAMSVRETDSSPDNSGTPVSVQDQNLNCETSGVIDQSNCNVTNGNKINIPECNKIEKIFNDFNNKMSLSNTDGASITVANKEIEEINTSNLDSIAAESISMTQDIIISDEVSKTSEKVEYPLAAESEIISHQEDEPLPQTTHSDSPNQTGQILRDNKLANNIGLEADSSNGNIKQIDHEVELVKKEETRSLGDDIYDKSSLDSLTPSFAHRLLENYNVSKDETDKAVSGDHDKLIREKNEDNRAKTELEGSFSKAMPTAPSAPKIRKYFYNEGQWSPSNPTGAKCYDRDFLMQLQDDPKSRLKPDNIISALLKTKMGSMESLHSFGSMPRSSNDSLLPMFVKNASQRGGMMMRSEPKKTSLQGKAPMKSSSSGMGKQNVIHVSLSLREDVKLNESENAWKPGRFKSLNASEEEKKTQDLYKNVRAVLNKITPQKFQALLGQIKALNIDNQERLEGVIDLVFEKAIDEPNYSVAYASMCKELGLMQVPANNPQDQLFVNFRSLIIKRCQERFQKTEEEESRILKEKDQMEAEDQVKLKFLEEESRKIRWKSVGNIRFIGELYKHNMLTTKIMNHCINTLVSDPDEQKLECLCKLLTTIGKELEKSTKLDTYFKLMKDMVDRKIYKGISSRVRFMLQDVIDLRARHWATKTNDVPRTMDEIQKEAEAEQRHIQIMNANPTSRKDDRGSSKRSNTGGRSGSTNSMDSDAWYTQKSRFSVDSSKFKNINSNVDNVKLGPSNMMQWNRGSGAKTSSLRSTPNPMMPITSNMYGLLENMSNETIPPIRSDIFSSQKDSSPDYHPKASSIERPTFKSTSTPAPLVSSGSGSGSGSSPAPEPMHEDKIKLLMGASLDEFFAFNDLKEIALDVTQRFNPRDHAVLIQEIFNIAFEKPEKVHEKISNVLVHLVVTSKAVSKENFLAGLEEILNCTSDLFIDIPMIYDYVATLLTPVILHQGLTLQQLFTASKLLLEANCGGRLIRCILNKIIANWGRNFTRSKWTSSGLSLKQWLAPDQVESFIQDNRFEFLEGDVDQIENTDTQLRLGSDITQKKLLELMNTEQSADCIDAWIREHVVKDNQFIRAFAQAMCEHALTPTDGRSAWLDMERLSKYTPLLMKYCVQKEWHLQCLLAVQQLIHKLEHPQGVTLDLFQHFFDEHIISEEAFSEWEKTDLEPEGKAVMLKALVSFFTQIREGDDDNDDSCSED